MVWIIETSNEDGHQLLYSTRDIALPRRKWQNAVAFAKLNLEPEQLRTAVKVNTDISGNDF